jgi:hypothetical protein
MLFLATSSKPEILWYFSLSSFLASTLAFPLCEHDPVVEGIDVLDTLASPETQIAMSGLALGGALRALVVAAGLCPAQVGTDLVGADELLVLVDDWATERTLLDDDRRQDEARADLDERDVGLALVAGNRRQGFGVCGLVLVTGLDGLGGLLLGDLIAADPDLAVAGEGEAHYVVGEGLDFAASGRHAEGVG